MKIEIKEIKISEVANKYLNDNEETSCWFCIVQTRQQIKIGSMTIERKTAYYNTFAIGGASCSANCLVAAEIYVACIYISGKNFVHRKSAKG